VAAGMKARTAEDAGRKEIETFNKRYVELHLKMDTAGILALWAEDGVDLMPGDAALMGRKKISTWVEDILAKMPGYKVMKQEMEFHDIHVCGEWASEWASEHQVVQPPDGKPVIESYGKMALVLRREANGEWKVQQECSSWPKAICGLTRKTQPPEDSRSGPTSPPYLRL
jgi:uncharacterized protein (TIGR02246 family)